MKAGLILSLAFAFFCNFGCGVARVPNPDSSPILTPSPSSSNNDAAFVADSAVTVDSVGGGTEQPKGFDAGVQLSDDAAVASDAASDITLPEPDTMLVGPEVQADLLPASADAALPNEPETAPPQPCGIPDRYLNEECPPDGTDRKGKLVCLSGQTVCIHTDPPPSSDCTNEREGNVEILSACPWTAGCEDNGHFSCQSGTWFCAGPYHISYGYVPPQCLPKNDAGAGGNPGSGGSTTLTTGGTIGTGGSTSLTTGGTTGTGGSTGSGGSVSTGGTTGSGGSVGTGGITSTGGTAETGGSSGTGGIVGTGGNGSGGITGTGGSTALTTGGSPGTGGSAPLTTGGTTGTGGAVGTGGSIMPSVDAGADSFSGGNDGPMIPASIGNITCTRDGATMTVTVNGIVSLGLVSALPAGSISSLALGMDWGLCWPTNGNSQGCFPIAVDPNTADSVSHTWTGIPLTRFTPRVTSSSWFQLRYWTILGDCVREGCGFCRDGETCVPTLEPPDGCIIRAKIPLDSGI